MATFSLETAPIIVLIGYLTMCIGFVVSKVNGYALFIVTMLILLVIGYQEQKLK